MPLLQEFKEALKNAIDDFNKKEGKLTTQQSQTAVTLKALIDAKESASDLLLEILREEKKLPKKTLAFLPFVNDLPKAMRKVLENPLFSQNLLMMDDMRGLRQENKRLDEENKWIKIQFEFFKVSGLDNETASTLSNLKDENRRLNAELIKIDKQHKQECEVITSEKAQLETDTISLTNKNERLQTELNKALLEKQQLTENNLQAVSENTVLKKQIQFLKDELAHYRENNVSESGNQQHNIYSHSY